MFHLLCLNFICVCFRYFAGAGRRMEEREIVYLYSPG